MTAFVPISPMKAVELVESAGVLDARRVISDNAAAGLVKSYARVIETESVAGGRDRVLGATVPTDLWQRIIREGAVEDVWTGGTVRLAAADLIGGAPAVSITGIGFAEKHLYQTIEHHLGVGSTKRRAKASLVKPVESEIDVTVGSSVDKGQPDPAAIPNGAVTVTVKQAMAALGLGRTKINDMMAKGTLVRIKIDTRTLITTDSIRALLL